MDVTTASPGISSALVDTVSVCRLWVHGLKYISSWTGNRDSQDTSEFGDDGSAVSCTANTTIHTCPLLLPVGASPPPESGACGAGDLQSTRNGQHSGIFLMDHSQRTLLTFQSLPVVLVSVPRVGFVLHRHGNCR